MDWPSTGVVGGEWRRGMRPAHTHEGLELFKGLTARDSLPTIPSLSATDVNANTFRRWLRHSSLLRPLFLFSLCTRSERRKTGHGDLWDDAGRTDPRNGGRRNVSIAPADPLAPSRRPRSRSSAALIGDFCRSAFQFSPGSAIVPRAAAFAMPFRRVSRYGRRARQVSPET